MGAGGSNTNQYVQDVTNIVLNVLQKNTANMDAYTNASNSVNITGNVTGVKIGSQSIVSSMDLTMLLRTDVSASTQNELIDKIVAKTKADTTVAGVTVSNTNVTQIVEKSVANNFRQETIQKLANVSILANTVNINGNVSNVDVAAANIKIDTVMKFASDIANNIVSELKASTDVSTDVTVKTSTILSDLVGAWQYIMLGLLVVVVIIVVMIIKNPDSVTKMADTIGKNAAISTDAAARMIKAVGDAKGVG